MVVLGVDPGIRVAGYSVLSIRNRQYRVLTYGAIALPRTASVASRVGQFYEHVSQIISQWHVTAISLETPFMGKNAQNFIKLGYVRGALFVLAHQNDIPLHEFTPRQVKQAVTGFGGAQKDQVARVVYWLCPGVREQKYQDVTDALAIAVCGCFVYI